MTIQQNVTNFTQSGTSQVIEVEANNLGFTGYQTYCLIFGLIFLASLSIVLVYKLIKYFVNKSCAGCSRLANCEKEIINIRKQLRLNECVDAESIKEMSEQLKELKKEVMSKWKN